MEKVLQISFLIFAVVLAVSAQCPTIIPRGGWNARTPRAIPVLPIRPAPLVVLHSTETPSCSNLVDCGAIIRDIQTFQMEANGWPDISYHFLVGPDENIYEGRGWGRMGQNIDQFTNQAINIAYIGAFAANASAGVTAFMDPLIDCGISIGALTQNVSVVAQCQVTQFVSCQTSSIFDWVSDHPRFTDSPTPV